MISYGTLRTEQNGHQEEYSLDYIVNGDGDPVVNNNQNQISKWARDAVQLLGRGELEKSLHFMNLCLDEKCRNKYLAADKNFSLQNALSSIQFYENYSLSDSDELILLEKRCLLQIKLKMYDKVWEGASRIISKRSDHAVAFKCILASLCKTDKYSYTSDVLNLWKKCAPNDLDMLESRTKIENLINAVKNGIEPSSAFSDIEEILGLSTDWIFGRKVYEPQWKYRSLPTGSSTFVLCLQFRFGHCSLADKCPDAHGQQELEEWKIRHSILNLSSLLDYCELEHEASYLKCIMDTLTRLEDPKEFLKDELPGVTVSCLQPYQTQIQSTVMKTHTWEFKIESKSPLSHICLLNEVHRPYFRIGSALFNGQKSTLNLKTGKAVTEPSLQVLQASISESAIALTGPIPEKYTYTVEVICTPDVFGTFRQTVVFDFDGDVKLIREIVVEVVPSREEDSELKGSAKQKRKVDNCMAFASNLKSRRTWNFGNAEIVDSERGERVASSKVGFALMTSPKFKKRETNLNSDKEFHYSLNKENYKDRMRLFLTQEERARQVILSKYNISAHLTLLHCYEMKGGNNEGTRYAVDGNLFGRMVLFRDISEDTPVGRLILRSCNSVLLAKTDYIDKCETDDSKPKVFLSPIAGKTKNAMYFDVGRECVRELELENGQVYSFDIQFQLDRTSFMEQKEVIDQITDKHLNMLFPDFSRTFQIPWNPLMQWNPSVDSKLIRLNPRQKEAFNAVTADITDLIPLPPILIIGPFGTGKTFTLFQCIKKILEQEDSRVLICTHSNSAADLYIKEYLNPLLKSGVESARPLRIYYTYRRKLTVDREIRDFCLFDDLDRFRCPTQEEVLRHRIIVVTLSTSYTLINLELPSDCFSHILLDEAAQAMESEAITPLLAAGERTKLVLAGDHMQLSPELFSEEAKHFHSSLLERLHWVYPDSHPCKLMLCENYRSHSAIIKFASDSFYSNKLECGMNQPIHNDYYPLTFFAARGEDIQEADSTSYYNMAEVFEVTKRVNDLIQSWPEKWGDWRKDNQIGVLTPYPDQVARIRQRLRKSGYYSVSVERVLNVQGKQFRAVILSTVRTHKPWVRILPEAVGNEVDMGFYSNPKLLNTALTRAQSLVAVVGDPVSLCSLGKCRRLWEDFIIICNENESLHGMTYEQIKRNIVGVELRLLWGLNPLANEYIPKPFQSIATSSTPAITFSNNEKQVSTKAPLISVPPMPVLTSTTDSTNRTFPIPPTQFTNNSARFAPPTQSHWPPHHNLPPNYTQFHPQGQLPIPMYPVPIVMNPNPLSVYPNGSGGMLPVPQSFPASYGTMQRQPILVPPVGQRLIAVPLHNRNASAFAQYRPQHPTIQRPPVPTLQNYPQPPSTGHQTLGLGYAHQVKPNFPIQSSNVIGVNPNTQLGVGSGDKNALPQPLTRPPDVNLHIPIHSGLEHHQSNFLPEQLPWSNIIQRAPTLQAAAVRQPQQPAQLNSTLKPLWFPAPVSSSSMVQPSLDSSMTVSQKFSPEELMYLKQILEERKSSFAPDEAIESIQEKLTQAVGGLNLNSTPTTSYPGHSKIQSNKQLQPGDVTRPKPFITTSEGVPLIYKIGSYYQNGESLCNGLPSPRNTSNMMRIDELGSMQSALRGVPWSNEPSHHHPEQTHLGLMNTRGMMMVPNDGFTSVPSHSNFDNTNITHIKAVTQNPELTVGWMRPHIATTSVASSNKLNHSMDEYCEPGSANEIRRTLTSSSPYFRSYASAVKQPIPQNGQNLMVTIDGGGTGNFETKKVIAKPRAKNAPQIKSLMDLDMDGEFPIPPCLSPGGLRSRTSPAPRFRGSTSRKSKKKK